MRRVIFILAGSLILILSGCPNYEIPVPECPDGIPDMSFSSDIQPIFDKDCTSCHSGSQSPDLREDWAYEELISGDGYVDTDFPCSSKLYEVFSGSHSGRTTDEEILEILGWIQDGALNN